MPAMYAHQRFGEIVYDELPQSVRGRIDSCRDLYDIGLQGPDIFFYQDPIRWGKYPQYGNRLHGMSGHAFFRMALNRYGSRYGWIRPSEEAVRENRQTAASEEAAMETRVYLYGAVCHYALDSICHPYINRVDATGVTTHAELEGDFDRHILELEGKNPVKENISRGIRPSSRAAKAVSVVYPEADEGVVLHSLRGCVCFQTLLLCRSDAKRNLLYRGIRKLGKERSLKPHIMSPTADPNCAEALPHMDELFREAVPLAVRRIVQMDDELERSLVPDVDSPDYDRDFDGKGTAPGR